MMSRTGRSHGRVMRQPRSRSKARQADSSSLGLVQIASAAARASASMKTEATWTRVLPDEWTTSTMGLRDAGAVSISVESDTVEPSDSSNGWWLTAAALSRRRTAAWSTFDLS